MSPQILLVKTSPLGDVVKERADNRGGRGNLYYAFFVRSLI